MFTLRLFIAGLMTVTRKFRLPIGRLSQSINKKCEFSSVDAEGPTEKNRGFQTESPVCSGFLIRNLYFIGYN